MQPAPNRHAPISLWRIAETFLQTFFALFGAPEVIAARHTLAPKQRALILAWVRAGEALMRRMLLIEARAFAKPNTRPLLRQSRPRVRKLMGFSEEHPEKWRVSFRCFNTDRRLPAGRKSGRQDAGSPSMQFGSAWPIAERAEAMLRVFNDPAPYARRLATRLHATPHRRREVLALPAPRRPISGAPPDARDMIGRDFLLLLDQAIAAPNSS